MRIYQNPLSSNARRVTMTALELGLDADVVFVDLAKGEHKKPEYLRMNPSGKVPTLDDDGFFLTESHAIMLYLADKTPGQKLYPAETRARADVHRWLFWSAHQLSPSVGILNWENVVKGFLGLGGPEPVLVEKGLRDVRENLRVLNFALEGKTWLVDDRLTLADLAVATPLMATVPAKLPVGEFPHVVAWFDRIRARDSWKKTEPTR